MCDAYPVQNELWPTRWGQTGRNDDAARIALDYRRPLFHPDQGEIRGPVSWEIRKFLRWCVLAVLAQLKEGSTATKQWDIFIVMGMNDPLWSSEVVPMWTYEHSGKNWEFWRCCEMSSFWSRLRVESRSEHRSLRELLCQISTSSTFWKWMIWLDSEFFTPFCNAYVAIIETLDGKHLDEEKKKQRNHETMAQQTGAINKSMTWETALAACKRIE